MKKLIRPLTLCLLLAVTAGAGFASSDPGPRSFGVCEPDGVQASGAIYRICMPPASYWNGDLVIWAHGYVAFNEPFGIREDQLCIGTVCLPGLTNALGFAFATTSYAANGLAILPGVADVEDLVNVFAAAHGAPRRVYLVGASEGGIGRRWPWSSAPTSSPAAWRRAGRSGISISRSSTTATSGWCSIISFQACCPTTWSPSRRA